MSQIQENFVSLQILDIKLDMAELYWTNKHGKECKAIFPKNKAEIFLVKHLIPQKELNLITNVGIREII